MSYTERYRAQHAEIMRLATELGRHLTPDALQRDASAPRAVLAELSGKLLVHLAAEDNVLYPRMLKSSDAKARALAQRFIDEMQPISKAFKDYAVRWGSARAIQSGAEAFIHETREILAALGERVRREHAELYALADKLGTGI